MSTSKTSEGEGSRSRGRPSVVDAERIAEIAVALWAERGFRETGWKDIADRVGVSTRTLMRHFSTRSEIPWVGVAAAAERLAASLQAAPADIPTGEALRIAVVESVTHTDQIRRMAPGWIALVSAEPDLAAAAPRAYAPWTESIAVFIAHRNPHAPTAICHALAAAYQAATFAALAEWARDGAREEPDEAVDQMLRWLDVHSPSATMPRQSPLGRSPQ